MKMKMLATILKLEKVLGVHEVAEQLEIYSISVPSFLQAVRSNAPEM